MELEQVKDAIKVAQDNFKKVKRGMALEQQIIDQHSKKHDALAQEALRLQGEYRALNRLLPPEMRDPKVQDIDVQEGPGAAEEGALANNEDSHGNG